MPESDSHISYVPPHPQDGSPAHRYVLLLLEQPSNTQLASSALPSSSHADRLGFDLRAFIKQHGLLNYVEVRKQSGGVNGVEEIIKSGETVMDRKKIDVEEGGGIAMWREAWDGSVSEIYEKVIGTCSKRCARNRVAEQSLMISAFNAGVPEPKYRRG